MNFKAILQTYVLTTMATFVCSDFSCWWGQDLIIVGGAYYLGSGSTCTPCRYRSEYCIGDGRRRPCKTTCEGYYQGPCTETRDTICCGSSKMDTYCVPNGYYNPGYGNVLCTPACPEGTIESSPCLGERDITCTTCDAGLYAQNGICKPCVDGTYPVGNICKTCEAGYFCRNNTKAACPAGSISDPGSFHYLQCHCKTGLFGKVYGPTASTCTPCPSGSFCPMTVVKTICDC